MFASRWFTRQVLQFCLSYWLWLCLDVGSHSTLEATVEVTHSSLNDTDEVSCLVDRNNLSTDQAKTDVDMQTDSSWQCVPGHDGLKKQVS